jgi:hypothetical protein
MIPDGKKSQTRQAMVEAVLHFIGPRDIHRYMLANVC